MVRYPHFFSSSDFRSESETVLDTKIHAIVKAMTQDEKLSFCFGGENPPIPGKIANAGYMPGVPRLGVPEIRMFDGPAGTTYIKPTTCMPAQGAMACAWSRDLAYAYGSVIGRENASVSGNCQLGAQFDTIRTSHFERAKDMMGEDPVLQAELAANVSSGMASQHVITVGKHFAACVRSCCPAFDADFIVDEQTLHQLYLLPFENAISAGGCSGIMTAYNMVNGAWASSSKYLNETVLRDMWNFKGFTITDWGANHEFTANKGTDIEMPSAEHNSPEKINEAIEKGELSRSRLDEIATHILWAMGKAGYLSLVRLDEQGHVLEQAGRHEPICMKNTYDDIAAEMLVAHGKVALDIARQSAVLLKNDNNFLPLRPSDYTEGNAVAVIGVSAGRLISGESQERAFGDLNQMKSPLAELRRISGSYNGFDYATGIDMIGETIPPEYFYTDEACLSHGLIRTYGVSAEDGQGTNMFGPGGAGQEYIGDSKSSPMPEDDIPIPVGIFNSNASGVMENHALGEYRTVDLAIDFTCGSIDGQINMTYKNSSDGTAFEYGSIYTWRGFLKAPETGDYELLLHCIGAVAGFKISFDGGKTWDIAGDTNTREGAHWGWSRILCTEEGMDICGNVFHLEAGQRYPVMFYCNGKVKEKDVQIRAAWITPSKRELDYKNALELAANHKKILVFVDRGTGASASGMMEARQQLGSFTLSAEQETLLADICQVAKSKGNRLGVVMFCSTAFVMKAWADQAEALLDMWLPGQNGGTATAELLLGCENPSGKTTQSFPFREQDTPITDTDEHYQTRYVGKMAGKRRVTVEFSEGILTGYRWHDAAGIEPRFCFGHGLSYTRFKYSDLSVRTNEDGEIVVDVTIANEGNYSGSEIVQIYAMAAEAPDYVQMARKQLVGFFRTDVLSPGESTGISVPLSRRGLSYWDSKASLTAQPNGSKGKWVLPKGERTLLVGASSQDIRLKTLIRV